MRTSYMFVLFLTTVLIAQVVSPAPPKKEKSSKQEINQKKTSSGSELKSKKADKKENTDEEDDYDTPVLTCAAFDEDAACNSMCSIVSSIYAEPVSTGTCILGKYCECSIPPTPSLRDLWNLKFKSATILDRIEARKNQKLLDKIYNVLKTPSRTPQQTKKALQKLLSGNQLKNLQLRDESLQELFSEDGSPNVDSVQRYVADKLKSLDEPIEGRYYTRPLMQAMASSDQNTADQIAHAVRHSKNKRLNELLTEYIEDNNVQIGSLQSDDPDSLVDILDAAIVNETITPTVFVDTIKRNLKRKSNN